MNAASGPAKIDAIAELFTTLVEERRMMTEPMMSNMMNMMGGRGGHSDTAPSNPQKVNRRHDDEPRAHDQPMMPRTNVSQAIQFRFVTFL